MRRLRAGTTQRRGNPAADMTPYRDLALQDGVKERYRCKLHALERKCCGGVEKLKALMAEHLPVSELLEKTGVLLMLRRALLSHHGYATSARDVLRLFPDAQDDLAPLCF